MADSENTHMEEPAAALLQPRPEQVTLKIPTTTPVKEKNLKRVAVGKALQEKGRKVHEEQKKAAEATVAVGLVPPLTGG